MTIKSQLKTEIKNKFNINIDDYCPKNDEDAWLLYPNYNFIYNKIFICQIQNLSYAPMPILPNKYPVVIKPIINLMGMGINAIKINNAEEFLVHYNNSHFWSEFIYGTHHSWDLIIKNGEIQYICCFKGHKDNKKFGTFKYWSLQKKINIPSIITKLVLDHFKKYTGCINIETINNKIIECHLRMGDIDQLPKDFLRLILLNYINKIPDIKEEFKKLILDVDIYLFPVWQTIKEYHDLNNIYNYLKISWEQKLIDMDDIIMYYFDNIGHAHPNKYKRWFLFSINNYDDGLKLKNKIENDINIKFL